MWGVSSRRSGTDWALALLSGALLAASRPPVDLGAARVRRPGAAPGRDPRRPAAARRGIGAPGRSRVLRGRHVVGVLLRRGGDRAARAGARGVLGRGDRDGRGPCPAPPGAPGDHRGRLGVRRGARRPVAARRVLLGRARLRDARHRAGAQRRRARRPAARVVRRRARRRDGRRDRRHGPEPARSPWARAARRRARRRGRRRRRVVRGVAAPARDRTPARRARAGQRRRPLPHRRRAPGPPAAGAALRARRRACGVTTTWWCSRSRAWTPRRSATRTWSSTSGRRRPASVPTSSRTGRRTCPTARRRISTCCSRPTAASSARTRSAISCRSASTCPGARPCSR